MTVRWITLEGIEGVGKTYLARQLADRLGRRCRLLDEVTDAASGTLTSQVITALSRTGDLWLRTGHPATETLALLALKTAEYEQVHLGYADIVIEDRGIDSVAIYQALILTGLDAPAAELHRVMNLIYATAARWRPLPDLALLLTDTPAACAVRLQQRTGATLSAADRKLMVRAAEMYAWQAERQPDRFRVVSRNGQGTQATLDALVDACTPVIAGRVVSA